MTLRDKLRQSILKFLKLDKLGENPNSDRFTFIGDPEDIIKRKLQEFKVWYYGNSDELLNFYTAMETYGNYKEPIYNRNKQNYFWGLSADECKVKRVHSGMPKAIIETLTNIVGMPNITCEQQETLDFIIKKTKLTNIINQKQLPMTLALGWGCFKPIIDKQVCKDSPLVEWYNADDVEFVVKHDVIIGVLFMDYYYYQNKDYVLVETRRVVDGDSRIEYKLYRYEKDNSVVEVELDTIPDLADLSKDGLVIKGLDKILAVPSVFFYDMNNKNYGRSILDGKIDLFDDLDQDLSQASQTSRVSTPVEYYPVDLLERDKFGRARMPQVYNRQFIASNSYPNGDGELNGDIRTTQPNVNFNQYNEKVLSDINLILTGILSPATLGLNIAKDDTALSQREKEKVSVMTRNNILDRQQVIIAELCEQLLMLKEFMETGTISIKEYDIGVKFSEFANPSFEEKANLLSQMFSSGTISPEMFVDKLYGDSLSDDEREKEISYLVEQQQKDDNLDLSEFENEGTITEDSNIERAEQESIDELEY